MRDNGVIFYVNGSNFFIYMFVGFCKLVNLSIVCFLLFLFQTLFVYLMIVIYAMYRILIANRSSLSKCNRFQKLT